MGLNRKTFVFYKDWMEAIRDLPDDIRLEIYESVIVYATTGNLQGLKPMAKVAFNFIKTDLDRDTEKYMSTTERNKNNGAKGGRPRKETPNNPKNPSGFQETQGNPKKHDNVNDNDNVNELEKERLSNDNPKKDFFNAENEFELFRKEYPGKKRGASTELESFKKKHKDWRDVIPILLPAIQVQMREHERLRSAGRFAPEYANLSTWINNRRWEYEVETAKDMILGDGEFLLEGTRYYGDPRGVKTKIPDNALPRPSMFHGWSKELNDWVML